jgi:hypothetical protein
MGLIALTSCGGGGGGNTSPSPSQNNGSGTIQGPNSLNEGSSAEYRVERAATTSAAYHWTCDPPTSGQITSPTSQATVFKAGAVSQDTPVKIAVSITPENGSASISNITVTVKHVPETGNPPIASTPVASAEVDRDMIKPGQSVHLTDTSTDPDGAATITKVEWDFTYEAAAGFHADSTERQPVATYPEIGEFLIQMRVTDVAGLTDLLDTPITISVTDGHLPPVAIAIFVPDTVEVCKPVQFQNNGSYGQDGASLTAYEWDWDNDGTFDENALHAEHSFSMPGLHQVQFRVTDNQGAQGVLTTPLQINVTNTPPVASALVLPLTGIRVGQNISFDATASSDADCNGNIAKYEWDWQNDGIYDDMGSTINRLFDYSGHKTVQLRVTDDQGATDLLDAPIEIDVASGNSLVWGGTGHDAGAAVAIDPQGNAYITGAFTGTADFDPGIGENIVTSTASSTAYLSKIDPDGNLVWVKTWGTNGENAGYDVIVSNAGFIYVTGTTTLMKFNYQGTVLWTYNSYKCGYAVTIDDQKGIYISGLFLPPNQMFPDAYLANFDFDGNLIWEKSWGSSGSDQANDIALDSYGEVYVIGHYDGTVDLNPGPGTDYHYTWYDGNTDSFLSRFHPDGTYVWGKSWGSTDAYGMAVGNSNQIYVTGYYEGTTGFDPDYDSFYLYDDVGTYLSCFSVSGSHTWTCGWSAGHGNSSRFDPGYSIAIGNDGTVYISGAFETTTDFDPYYYGTDYRYGGGAYLTRFTSDGWYLGSYTWGSYSETAWDNAWDVTLNTEGNPVVVGNYHTTCNFNIDGDEIRTSRGDHDAFMLTFPADAEW